MKNVKTSNLTNLVLIFLFVFSLIFFLLQIPFVNELNNLLLDRLQGSLLPREEIVIIGIDDKSLEHIGPWPWDRNIFAEAFKNLPTQTSVVGLDILFLEPRDHDEDLSDYFETTDINFVLATKFIDNQMLNPVFSQDQIQLGYIHLYPDIDGKIRQTSLAEIRNNDCLESFALSLFANYLRLDLIECSDLKIQLENRIFDTFVKFNYTDQSFETFSFLDLYTNKIDPNKLKNKIVLIGATTSDLRTNLADNFININGDNIPGVLIHANILNSILHNKFQTDIGLWLLFVFSFLSSIFLFYSFINIRNNLLDVTLLISFLIFNNILGVFLHSFGINWNFLTTNFIFIIVYISSIIYKYITEKSQKRFIQRAFEQYISPKLLKKIITNPNLLVLGGEKKLITVFFSDIRSFTSISEQLTPEQLLSLLNEYLDTMSKIILKNQGTIDKYIGDCIMAFWGAPLGDKHQRENALKSALEIEKALKTFNEKHLQFPDIDIGIGINTQEMIVGNIGSSQRFDYTVLGDGVNLASRLESLTKEYRIKTLISKNVIDNTASSNTNMIFRKIDDVLVKGKNKPVEIFQPLEKTISNLKLTQNYQKAFKYYQASNFEKAFKILAKIENDGPSNLLIQRIKNGMHENFNGIWKWDHK